MSLATRRRFTTALDDEQRARLKAWATKHGRSLHDALQCLVSLALGLPLPPPVKRGRPKRAP